MGERIRRPVLSFDASLSHRLHGDSRSVVEIAVCVDSYSKCPADGSTVDVWSVFGNERSRLTGELSSTTPAENTRHQD